MSFLDHLICSRCQRTHSADAPHNLCSCGGPLLAVYDLDGVKRQLHPHDLRTRPASLWRYRELLPVRDPTHIVSLGEGWTPLLPAPRLGRVLDVPHLLIKDEGPNPTGTFKARGAAVGVSRARELGLRELAMPTAGNAGGAWAAYAAAAGLRLHVAMPQDAPPVNRVECQLYGAELTLVDGLISDAGRLIAQQAAQHGWFDVATLKEPYRVEGKKTMGLEIVEQLGWGLPDAIVYPAGGGVGIIGIWKALRELQRLSWIEGPLPRLCVVQAAGCAPLVRAFEEGRTASTFWENAHTVADGLRVPKALGDFLVLRAVRETGGAAVAVTDAAILDAMRQAARHAGLWMCPEGAATVAALTPLLERGTITPQDRVVVINTGTGLKYAQVGRKATADHFRP